MTQVSAFFLFSSSEVTENFITTKITKKLFFLQVKIRHGTASAIARRVVRPQDQKYPASVIAKEALSYHQDYSSSFKYGLRCVVNPGEEKDPRPDTKLLLSATIKAYPTQNLKLKSQYENVNKKINITSAEHQGPMLHPLKSFVALQNLVRLSL